MWNNQGGFQGYDQNKQQGGGGYMSPGGFGTPQQSQEKKSRNRLQSMLPVTVAEIFNATQNDDKFFTGDLEVYQVTFIGLVVSVSVSATRMDYEIDDMTGPPLEVKQFVDNDESIPEEEQVQPVTENTYVRVSGTVRSFGGKKSVVAFKISPIIDMNELTCHMLEVVHSHIAMAQAANQGSGAQVSNGTHNGMDTGGQGDMNGGMVSGLTPIQNQVHLAIRNNLTDQGANVSSICDQIRGVPEKAIREAIEFLSSEGHIYSTIDDEHYKATDS